MTGDPVASAPPPGPNFRIGHGYDIHRLEPGGPLMLGGVRVAEDVRPIAHSDGDVVIHAIVDALLGAMGWGDIGDRFPNTDASFKDTPSRTFLEQVWGEVRAAGFELSNIDVTILAERPKLKPFKRQMVEVLAGMLDAPADRINIKAGTNEGCDAIGRGEAIAAHVVVLLAARNPLESPPHAGMSPHQQLSHEPKRSETPGKPVTPGILKVLGAGSVLGGVATWLSAGVHEPEQVRAGFVIAVFGVLCFIGGMISKAVVKK